MVPFRLTRDLVHALGPLGVEAGFVRAAESALRAFSSGSDIILTLLEVGTVDHNVLIKNSFNMRPGTV